MTREQIAKRIEIMQAWINGKPIEYYGAISGTWHTITNPNPVFSNDVDYRIKPPEPKYRPWKPEEVPMGAVARLKDKDSYSKLRSLIVQVDSSHTIRLGDGGQFSPITFAENWEHSTDQGKTWLPCGVLE